MGLFSNFIDKMRPYQPKGELYKILYKHSSSLAMNVSITKYEKSLIEGILLFIGFCKLVTRGNSFISTDVLKPLLNEALDHIKHSGNLNYERNKNIQFVNLRIELYENEIYKTFSDNADNTYIGGIIVNNLFENPLNNSINRSQDIFKHLDLVTKLSEYFKEIGSYLNRHYDLKSEDEFDEILDDSLRNDDQRCPICGGLYDILDLKRISIIDDEVGGRIEMYACNYCIKKLEVSDDTFKYEE